MELLKTVAKLGAEHERELRRWLVGHDPEFALHRQLKDYFLAPTSAFGTMVVRVGEAQRIVTGVFYSTFNGTAFIHQYIGDMDNLPLIMERLGRPCQAFFREDQAQPNSSEGWRVELEVVPGYVVDHPAYDGVFSRIAPRFKGTVYELS
jgi:hypothetical protein